MEGAVKRERLIDSFIKKKGRKKLTATFHEELL